MDGNRFDDVTRSLRMTSPRRGALGWMLGGALGLAGLAEIEAKGKGKGKGKGKKKKKLDVCEKSAKACAGGKCTAGQACCSDLECDNCTNVYCVGGGGGRPGVCGCEGTDVMSNGRCGTKPQCIPAGQKREFTDIRCCSGNEITDIESPENGKCLPGVLSCLSNGDCTGGECRGYQCYGLELGCPAF